jgi:hypothetical protein
MLKLGVEADLAVCGGWQLHSALLNYKSKCVSAMITNTGDDNSALRNAFTYVA